MQNFPKRKLTFDGQNLMLYLLKSSDRLKIGFATDMQMRLKAYATHNPDYELIGTREGDLKDESFLHKVLSKYKVDNTEWMKYDPFIIDVFNNLDIPREYVRNNKNTKSIKNAVTRNTQNDCYIVFTDYNGYLLNTIHGKAMNLLTYLLNISEPNTGKISLTTAKRKEISTSLNITNNAITNYLKVLKDNKLILER